MNVSRVTDFVKRHAPSLISRSCCLEQYVFGAWRLIGSIHERLMQDTTVDRLRHPTIAGSLPEKVMLGAVAPQVLAMERRLAGFRSGDPSFIMQVLLSEQRTQSWDHAEEVVEALMRMPGNEAMAHHYGYGAGRNEDRAPIPGEVTLESVGSTR